MTEPEQRTSPGPAPDPASSTEQAPRGEVRPRARGALREFALIVAGVLVALAAQAWWERRAETDRADAYMRQLIADLNTTEQELQRSAGLTRHAEISAASVVRAFYAPDRAVPDSVTRWLMGSLGYSAAGVSLGTVHALITTGDLRLIEDDSVRAEIMRLLDLGTQYELHQRVSVDEFYRAAAAVTEVINLNELNAVRLGAGLDAQAASDPTVPIPPGAQRHPFPMDIEALLRREDVYQRMAALQNSLGLMVAIQEQMRGQVQEARERIESATRGS